MVLLSLLKSYLQKMHHHVVVFQVGQSPDGHIIARQWSYVEADGGQIKSQIVDGLVTQLGCRLLVLSQLWIKLKWETCERD